MAAAQGSLVLDHPSKFAKPGIADRPLQRSVPDHVFHGQILDHESPKGHAIMRANSDARGKIIPQENPH